MRAKEIRETYLSFFAERGHKIVPSASLVPSVHDPSVLLTTAGMQPFKPYFLGRDQPPAPRLADVQKCFRTTDIEEVGNTARHMTFFEMLGNWSFGDYFKAESIPWGWELSTQGFGMDPERIWVTVFGGDEELGLGPDEEAIEIWRATGVPEERIVRLGREDNFWQAGPTGPCGPCSELYLDRGPGFGAEGERPGDDTDRFLEFWNHVFMSYELAEDGSLTELPTKNIDTGMGLDRMAAILQDVPSVFETDHVRPLVDLAEELSGRRYDEGGAVTRAMRIVADHSRGAAFLIADGVVPSNEDRGYILRRIMRRAIQQGNTLGLEAPWLGRFAERTIELMGDDYPELVAERETIARWVGDEEESFGRTLERGTELLERLVAEAEAGETSWIDAAEAFKLHDTYGFPYDLTKELLAERGLSVDDQGFRGADGRAAPARPHGERNRARLREHATSASSPSPQERRRPSSSATRPCARPPASPRSSRSTARRWSSSSRAPSTPRAAARSPTRESCAGAGRRRACSTSTASAKTRRWRSIRAAPRSSPGSRSKPRSIRDPPRDDAQPHRHPPPARRPARAPRHPRAPGRLGRAPGQAALRLHPRPGAQPRGAARRRGPRQRVGQGEPRRSAG